jgi:hypothetical protein
MGSATSTIVTGKLADLDTMLARAKSDAGLGGQSWDDMSESERQRYFERLQAGYEVAAAAALAAQPLYSK